MLEKTHLRKLAPGASKDGGAMVAGMVMDEEKSERRVREEEEKELCSEGGAGQDSTGRENINEHAMFIVFFFKWNYAFAYFFKWDPKAHKYV